MQRKRGQDRRRLIHITRLQAFIKGKRQLKRYRIMKTAQIILAWFWRKIWRIKYTKFAVKIQRLFRRFCLLSAVIIIQRMIRGFIARRSTRRLNQKLVVLGKHRCALEQHSLAKSLHKASLIFAPIFLEDAILQMQVISPSKITYTIY